MAKRKFPDTFTVKVDGKTAAWAAMDKFRVQGESLDVAGGLLLGDESLLEEVSDILRTDNVVTEVKVLHPGVFYEFTQGRDTPSDVAAAMIHAGHGRSILSTSGWEYLYAALDDSSEDEDSYVEDEAEIIH